MTIVNGEYNSVLLYGCLQIIIPMKQWKFVLSARPLFMCIHSETMVTISILNDVAVQNTEYEAKLSDHVPTCVLVAF